MEWINRIRKSRKGFTLVEIIVVLVILAILAAFTIPTMLGFVQDAKGKALIAEAREVYVAAQATSTEYVASGKTIAATDLNSSVVQPSTAANASLQMQNYLKNDFTISATALTNPVTATSKPATDAAAWIVTFDTTTGKVTQIFFVKNGYSITIAEPAGTTTVAKLTV